MNIREKMEQFNERWNITSEDSYEVAFNKFKIRILNILKDIDDYVSEESISEFCQFYGIKEVWHPSPYNLYKNEYSTNIIDRLNKEEKEKEFYKLIEIIFALNIDSIKWGLYKKVEKAIKLSDVNLAIAEKGGEIILYPKGEEILDQELVNSPISFLNKESSEHFRQALQFYQDKKHVKSAESLHRSLEEFLRYKLKNKKGLNANISEVQAKIKSDGRDSQVRNIIGSIFTYLDKYFDENSKHNDGEIDDTENEFLIYQMGLILKYLENILK